ncbi:4Fe-4S cluster-binding domain-containing protein [Brachyspira intermedia]|uniref:4Fe-4S cluster-binding domain-containing protein n=1 Tax=Brachyspira intermedia TaxID=84377 RepID=UPI00300489AC
MFNIKETNKYKIFTIFGIKIPFKKKTEKPYIDQIVWWIPNKNLRDKIRNLYYSLHAKIDETNNSLNTKIDETNHNLNMKINDILNTYIYSNNVYHINNTIPIMINHIKSQIPDNIIDYINFVINKVTPKSNIDFIEIALAEHCNLKCYSCNHFAQLAQEEYYNIEQFEKDIKRLYELTNGSVNRFSLMGGEPLLNKNCKDYFYILRKYFQNSSIWLVTNGILLIEQDDNFWISCRENNIEIRPTKYPININWEKIEEICKNNDVKLIFFNNPNIAKEMDKTILNLEGNSNTLLNFTNCYLANTCITLKNGKLFTCGLPSNIEHFNRFFDKKLEVTKFDYIDIYEAKNYNEILEFLAKPIPFCRYCDINKWHSIGNWTTSKKDINEYI